MTAKLPNDRLPQLTYELQLLNGGYQLIAGLDEAGRGAWAGPVTAGAAILHLDHADLLKELEGVRDSKLCTPRQRDDLFDLIISEALATGIGNATASEIDQWGIMSATRMAMTRAIRQLDRSPQALLIDGRYLSLSSFTIPQQNLVKGEYKSLSIAAASILAKVSRDRHMIEQADVYGDYGFSRHKGYGTPQHQQALNEYGPTPIHRHSFKPIAARLLKLEQDENLEEYRTGS